jgi:hypothetical protein
MAVIKASKGGKTLSRAINYAAKDEKVSGVNCPNDPKLACQQMNATKEMWDKEGGRIYKPYVQSFAPDEVTPEMAHGVGIDFAKKAWPQYEVIVGTHVTSKSGVIHNHFVVNSVSFATGQKIHTSNQELRDLKNLSDEICREHGLSVIDHTKNRDKGVIVAWDKNKYQAIAKALEGKGRSHVVDIGIAVSRTLEKSKGTDMGTFQRMLREQEGIEFTLEGKQGIKFIQADGKHASGVTLAKTFSNSDFIRQGIREIVMAKKLPEQNHTKEAPKRELIGEPSRNLEIPKMESLASIQNGIGRRGAEANSIGNLIQQTIKSDPKVAALDARVDDYQDIDWEWLTEEQKREKIAEIKRKEESREGICR